VKLRPQPFQVLQVLVERYGDVVTRDELRELLWPAVTFVDFEHGLNTGIKELRHALRDSASAPRYVETLPKRGYRMVGTVNPVAEPEFELSTHLLQAKPETAVSASAPAVRPSALRLDRVFLTLILVLIALGGTWEWHRLSGRDQSVSGRVMMAVLPFENLTGDPAQEYVGDGLTEEMITQLGRLNSQRFGVIARTSAMHYKHTPKRVGQIGHELNVQYVLEGSLREEPGKIRVAAQLIRVTDTAHHWYAEHLGYLGRLDEAFRESERARQLDPLSLIIAVDNGVLLIYSRQYDRAIQKCRSVLELDSHFNMAEGCVARAYKLKHMSTYALSVYETASHDFADPPYKWSELAYIYGRSGKQKQAQRALEKLSQLYRPGQTDPIVFAWVYLGLSDKDQTFAWLEKAYAQHSNSMATLKVDPIYDPLRADPRFQDLLRRVGPTN
jgi:TolB-like protein/DNA-binding winged helix-turn-helix (wHTH) protein